MDQELCQIIWEHHEEQKHILGYGQMTILMNRLSRTRYNEKRIRRLMRLMGISSIIRRKRKGYIKSTPQITAENVLNRQFKANESDTKWLTDVTEFPIGKGGGKLYLSAILDLYDRRIVSYLVSNRNNSQLVNETFDRAVAKYPQAEPLFHTDRGFQYTSIQFKHKLNRVNAIQSMSRVGRCIDNGPMEGFWGILKTEMKHLYEYHTYEELKMAISNYIDFYNNHRYQAKLKGLSPMEFRVQALKKVN